MAERTTLAGLQVPGFSRIWGRFDESVSAGIYGQNFGVKYVCEINMAF
jgi:hypothetical protein